MRSSRSASALLAASLALAVVAVPAFACDASKKSKGAVSAAAAGYDAVTAGYSAKPAKAGKTGDLLQVANKAGSFTTLEKAIHVAGLTSTLKTGGPFTVFAPTDEAFARLPAGALEALLKDREKLKAVLLYHVASGEVKAAEVVKKSTISTVGGGTLTVNTEGGVKVNNSNVVLTDVGASNGVIHVIDTVLLP